MAIVTMINKFLQSESTIRRPLGLNQLRDTFSSLTVLLLLICGNATAETARFSVVDKDGAPIPNAVVELELPAEIAAQFQQQTSVSIDQVDKEFVPELTLITKDSTINFPNSDDILHHVYSFSETKEFNIPLYGDGEQQEFSEVFESTGVVEIGCNIHDWMLAYVYVADSIKVGKTDEHGIVEIDVPVGNYNAKVWHSRLSRRQNELSQSVDVVSRNVSEVTFEIQLTRDRRIRRAPSAGRSRYR